MAEDMERLIVQLEASIKGFERQMARVSGISDKAARAAESRFKLMNKRLDAATAGLGASLIPSLGAIGGALAIGEVAKYADAWTRAKNSLAVAGVVGQQQAVVLETLFQSAQRNGAPINALADLYGKAAQSQKELGATSASLTTFTDGVAVSLKAAGTDAQGASGALLQLGQLLGSGTVHAEEFNSVNEGARPILMAVAAGLDAAGGSVAKLKTLVNAGEVSSKAFFDAFIKGMPVVQALANNATQTLAQGYVKIENALTKYIGKQDQSFGATRVLSAGLNELADNFDHVADITLKLVSVIAAGLVGRALAPMIANLGLGTVAVFRFVAALRAAQGVSAAAAIAGLGVTAGPLGAALGIAAAAGLYFYESSKLVNSGAANASDAIKQLGISGRSSAADIRLAADALRDLTEVERNRKLAENDALIRDKSIELSRVSLKDIGVDGRAASPEGRALAATLTDLNDRAKKGKISQDEYNLALDELVKKNPKLQKIAEQYQAITGAIFAALKNQEALNKAVELGSKGPAAAPTYRSAEDRSMKALGEARADTGAFLDKRTQDQNRTEREKDIEDRAKQIADALTKAGKFIDTAAVKLQATKEIDKEFADKQTKSFNSDAIKDYVDRVVKAESGGKADAKNPNSSATGVGQFIESTWLALFRKYYPNEAATMGTSAILDQRKNGEISKNLIEKYAEENAAALQKSGHAVTEANLHLAHFLGAGGANAILSAAPGAKAADVLAPSQVRANPTILGNGATRESVLAYADKRANATRIQAGDLTTSEKSAKDFTETLADSDKRTAALARETEAINQSAYARAFAAEKAVLLEAAEKDGEKASPEKIAQIDAKAAAYARQSVAQDQVKASAKDIGEAQDFFAEGATSAFTDIITGASTAEAAMKKLASSILEAVIQATLLGKGPLAGIFGTANPAGGTGGLFGSLFSVFSGGGGAGAVKAATGGKVVGPGTGTSDSVPAYLSDGEHVVNATQAKKHRRLLEAINSGRVGKFARGGEVGGMSMPSMAAMVSMPRIPKVQPAARNGGTVAVTTAINLTGANGDETIRRIAYDEAQKGMSAGLKAYDRRLGARLDSMQKLER